MAFGELMMREEASISDMICPLGAGTTSHVIAVPGLIVATTILREEEGCTAMTPLEKIQSMKMPFGELKGVTFTEADRDRVVARMLVRPDLCTLGHMLHGGAIMALADSVGAAATVINLPEDAKGTTTLESKTNFISGVK